MNYPFAESDKAKEGTMQTRFWSRALLFTMVGLLVFFVLGNLFAAALRAEPETTPPPPRTPPTSTATRTPTPSETPTPTTGIIVLTSTPTATSDPGNCSTAPSKPKLTTPDNSSSTTKTRVMLKWNAAHCTDTYIITVKDVATGKNADKKAGWTALQYRTKALARSKTYKWNVKACNTHGCTKSVTWRFSVN